MGAMLIERAFPRKKVCEKFHVSGAMAWTGTGHAARWLSSWTAAPPNKKLFLPLAAATFSPVPSAPTHTVLRRAFIFCVLCFAVFRFSDHTVDTDLWGHVLFGGEFLQTHHLARTEPYSWTAPGHRWINHEIIAESTLALAHRALGGPGLLLLKTAAGLLAFLIAIATATARGGGAPSSGGLRLPSGTVAWAFGALAAGEISYGFAARPQIFTALALVMEFWLLKQIHAGHRRWAFALPPLFLLWINTHGGVLAGMMVLFVAAISTTVQPLARKLVPRPLRTRLALETAPGTALWLWLSFAASALALFANPYGFELVRWLIGSVQWLRPEIGEWDPPRLGSGHTAFFLCAAVAVAGVLCSRRPIALWELVCAGVFGFMAFRSMRHTPLFCLAALAFAPPHLTDAFERFSGAFARWTGVCRRPAPQKILTALLVLVASGILFATFTPRNGRAWTMEISRQQYPVAAVEFIKQHGLRGNLLVFFDWGEECLWELPDSRVSIDGRLDTCYPRAVIAAQLKFYNAEPFDPAALDLNQADFALLPSDMASAVQLGQSGGWQEVYFDERALVLARNAGQFPKLSGLKLPVEGVGMTNGWVPFPDLPSERLSASK